jgi:TIGR03009 family protein
MRRFLCLFLGVGALVTGSAECTRAQVAKKGSNPPATKQGTPAQAPTRPLPDQRRLDEILKRWEIESAANKTLDAIFEETEKSFTFQTVTKRQGRALLKSPNKAWLNFEQGAGKTLTPHERIICDGKKVYQFVYPEHQIRVYTLDARERQRALQEGPLPFLFDMHKDEALKRYQMILKDENADKCIIQIEPRDSIDRDVFSTAYVWLDKKKFLPEQLRLVDPSNKKDYKSYVFTKIDRSPDPHPELDGFFDGEALARKYESDRKANPRWDRIVPGDDEGNAARAGAQPKVGASGRATRRAMPNGRQ